MALTDRKRRFAAAIMSGATNREAAISAGYSGKTASQKGSALAKDADVIAHMERKGQIQEAKQEAKAQGDTLNIASLAKNYSDPLLFLNAVMNDGGEDMKLRVDAAKAMMPYVHGKKGEQGKKEQRVSAANAVSQGRFSAASPPLRAVK